MGQKLPFKILKLLGALLPLLFFAACGGSGGGTGTMSVGLTDSPTEAYSAVYITVDEVRVNAKDGALDSDGGWVTIATPHKTYNLLDLANGVVSGLGEGPLPSGTYHQIRLVIGTTPDASPNILCQPHPFANYVIDANDGSIHELTVPSGEESGLKLVCAGLCDIAPNQTTEVILDFDAAASVVVAGNSGNFNLKPTIKVLSTDAFTIVNGTVQQSGASGTTTAVADATVSGQTFDSAAADLKDQVVVNAATGSEADGTYELFIKPGDYNLVAYHDGFVPQAVNFTAVAGQVQTQDFLLAPSDMGNISGAVNIAGITQPTFAHLSFRQGTALAGEMVELKSADVLSGQSYNLALPVETYQVVSSTCGLTTQSANATLTSGATFLLDVNF